MVITGGHESGAELRVSWIVCAQATRDVVDRVVDCPLVGKVVVERCHDCHLLQVLESDWRHASCSTPET